MKNYPIGPREFVGALLRNWPLVQTMVWREVVGRYRGSMIGVLWSVFTPVLMLVVYTFVFSVVFKARWNAGSDSKTEFSLVLFAGLIVFNVFSECVNRAPTLIVSNVNYVKKVVFPLEILPWVCLGSALFQAVVSLSVWLVAYLILFGVPHWTVALLPLVAMPLLLFVIGIVFFFCSLGVFLRDTAQFVGVMTAVLMFLTPIFYPASALPEPYRSVIYLNPLTSMVEMVRSVMYWGAAPHWTSWVASLVGGGLVACAGFAWFQKTRKGFADVL